MAESTPGEYGSDWFEGAIARPGQVLKDFVRAIQPQLQKVRASIEGLASAGSADGGIGCLATSPCTPSDLMLLLVPTWPHLASSRT